MKSRGKSYRNAFSFLCLSLLLAAYSLGKSGFYKVPLLEFLSKSFTKSAFFFSCLGLFFFFFNLLAHFYFFPPTFKQHVFLKTIPLS